MYVCVCVSLTRCLLVLCCVYVCKSVTALTNIDIKPGGRTALRRQKFCLRMKSISGSMAFYVLLSVSIVEGNIYFIYLH